MSGTVWEIRCSMKSNLLFKTSLMKQILSVVTIALIMVACNSKSDSAAAAAQLEKFKDSLRMAADTAGLSEYREWKAYNEINQDETTEQTGQLAVAPVAAQRTTAPTRTSSPSRNRSVSNGSGSVSKGSGSGASQSSTATRKKGWSKAAKGAAIGGGTGAVVGAVVNKKNRVAGGVIGGVIGAGVGYGVGRAKDKKDGRY